LQATSYKMFEVGSLHLIHGKITTLPVNRDTRERLSGLSKALPSQNGNRPDQVRFYGFTGNVRPPTPALSKGLMVFSLIAGAGKSVVW
jgi:hypothetical protein